MSVLNTTKIYVAINYDLFHQNKIDFPVGWKGILAELCHGIERVNHEGSTVHITLEKPALTTAGIRICSSVHDHELKLLIEKAMVKSNTTCEICGMHGSLITQGGWPRIRCLNHVKTRLT